ncbi:MAG: C10 family peptidase [Salinivirgaceae bacterium]|nr:C10 family peptidase [Salinivirgaceae bacterium]
MNAKRLSKLAALLIFAVFSINAFAQQTVYTNRDVKVVQYPDCWQIISDDDVLGHGDGILDIDNLPPAFVYLLENYATQSGKTIGRSASKSDSVVYGPLLRTAWNQRSPYNDECPTVNGEHTLTGCSTISSSQLMYYYRYCKPFSIEDENVMSDEITASDTVQSPYFTSIDSMKYTYKYSYTPDFAKISTDDSELAKFIVGVAFVQKAEFGLKETSTFDKIQLSSLKDVFGYKGEKYYIEEMSDSAYIENAIKKGRPIIISGDSEGGGGHSFMVDGFNGEEFHVDFGWGGSSNGWFTTTKYNENMRILVLQPDVEDIANIQSAPEYVYVKDVDNLAEQKLSMVKVEGGNLQYKLAETVTLEPGEYEFYYEYADGSKAAPYSDSTVTLNTSSTYTHYGLYVTTPARFKLTKTYNIDFWHDAGLAEVKVVVADARIAISGKVMAADSTPLAGAVVTTADSIPLPETDCQNLTDRNIGTSFDNVAISFVPSKKFITKVDASVFLKGAPGELTVSILDGNKKVLAERRFPQSDFSTSFKWIGFELDAPLAVTPGQKYYINLSAFKDDDNCYYCKNDYDKNPAYQVIGVNDYFTTTDAAGKYSFPVEKYSSGQLNAFFSDNEFDVVTFDNIDENQTDRDIVELNAAEIVISGKVLDLSSAPIEGAVVTDALNIPELVINQENTDKSTKGYRVETDGSTIEAFIPQKAIIAKVAFNMFTKGDPGNLTVTVLDKNKNEIGSATINYTQIESGWTEIEFGTLLKVVPNETHYIVLTADKCEDDNRINYYYDNSTDRNMVYRIWGYDNFFAATDADGKYTFTVDRNWSGTLHAYYSGKTFNNLKFIEIFHSDSVKNFKENETNITNDYTLKSISLTPPTKTEYIVGESIDRTGMVITGTYGDGSTAKINNYTISGFATDNIGEKTVTVSAGNLSATYKINVKTNKYSITYKSDSAVYTKVDHILGMSVKVAESPTKTGYTFMGWTPDVPLRMPAEDVTVDAVWQINDYTLTYMVEDTVYKSVKVTYNEKVDSIAVPEKTGYTFTGWSQKIPEMMPAEDLTVDAVWQINDYTLTYMVEDTVYKSVNVTYDEKIDSITVPEKTGYTFKGWVGLPETMPAMDTTVEAQWQINSYVVTFNTDGGSTISEVTVEYNSVIVTPENPTKDGFIFDGWTPAIPTSGVTEDMTFTAKWVVAPEPGTAIADNAIVGIRIWAHGNKIVVENSVDEILVYNAVGAEVGREVASPVSTITINRPGLYIVKTGNIAKRVILK